MKSRYANSVEEMRRNYVCKKNELCKSLKKEFCVCGIVKVYLICCRHKKVLLVFMVAKDQSVFGMLYNTIVNMF
uniref:Uncharacterized protein n=1 Tax=Anguilla anguilla TaxID=7936 RepID=A0A0E9WP24_ANGAN